MKSQCQHIIVLIAGFLLWSCSTDKSDYAKLVSEWQGRDIIFPKMMTDVLTGDTIDFKDADFTILTYIDSVGCTSCRMKLPLWNVFIESLDSISSDYDVVPIIVVNTNDSSNLSYLIRRDDYAYLIFADSADSLNVLNHFPSESNLRTLLLDCNNRVVAMGNPITNNAIADLYRSIISGSKTFNPSGQQVIIADPSKIQLGNIPRGKELSTEFHLENQGCDTVHIRNITTSCPCTEVIMSSADIPPGENRPVYVKLREDSINGDFQRTIHIFYQDFENPTILVLSGTII